MQAQNNKKEQVVIPIGPRRGGGPMGARMNAEKPKDGKKTILRLLSYLGRNKKILIAMVLLVLCTAAFTLAAPALQGEAVNIIAGQRK